MSGTVDEEVVRMRFDSGTFERGVATAISTLQRLKSHLSFGKAGQGLDDIQAKASKFNLNEMGASTEGVSKKFLAMSTIAITALANITTRAVSAGINFVKGFSVSPILDGLHEYETNLQSIQTIQANTDQPLSKIQASLNELNHYSDQTIYNFSEMARNIGTFTAAGVDLKTATSSIKGIANLAALSGSSSQQASTAMYQLSQAISSGRVSLQDWNSVVNAGMGGKKLQTALATTAQAMGVLGKGAIGTSGKMKTLTIDGKSFRESITAKPGQKPWFTSEVLVNTLATLDGRFSAVALRAELTTDGVRKYSEGQIQAKIHTARLALEQKNGVKYTDAQFKSLKRLSDSSFLAATQVKTLSQVFDVAKETIGSGWSASFASIFGTFGEAKKTFTELSGAINGVINKNALARNTILHDWNKAGGRTAGIEAIKNVFTALGAVLRPIKNAFRDLFPRKTGDQLAVTTYRLQQFTEKLKPSAKTVTEIHRVFRGLFSLFDIGKQIVDGVFTVFKRLFGAAHNGSKGFLGVAASVGDMVYRFDKALKSGDVLHNFFKILGNVLAIPIHVAGLLGHAIGRIFAGFHLKDGRNTISILDRVAAKLERAAHVTDGLTGFFNNLGQKIGPAVSAVGRAFGKIGQAISKGLGSQQFANILKTFQVGFLGGILLVLKKFLSGGLGGVHIDGGSGLFGRAKEALEGVTGALKSMQTQLKAKALLEIAAAMGILAISVVALGQTDPKKLKAGLTAMAVGFGQLLVSMAILSKISGAGGALKLPLLAASLVLIATAILILTGAVIALSLVKWEQLKQGLIAVGLLLGALVIAGLALSTASVGLAAAGVGMVGIAVALNLLFVAVKAFSTMNWKDMIKGLEGVGLVLAGLAIAMRLMPKGMVLQAAAILLLAVALQGLYLAVREFSSFDYPTMIRGIVGIAGALGAIALGMKFMPKGMVLQAVALNILAIALQSIGKAVATMGGLSWTVIAKGLITIAGALGIIAAAVNLMSGTLLGAAALVVVAGALKLLVPVITTLGKMKLSELAIGLGAIAAVFGVIGLSALVLSPVIPVILALGVALGLVGVAMLAFGGGAALLGVGLTAIAASGAAAVGVLLHAVSGMVALLPKIALAVGQALVNILRVIGKNAPTIIAAFVKLLEELLKAVPKLVPRLVTAIGALITGLCKAITQNVPKIVAAGFSLLMGLLKGISSNISRITRVVVDIVVKFLRTLADNIGRIINAGVYLLTKFLIGIASALGKMPGLVFRVIGAFLSSLFGGLGRLVSAGARMLGSLISGIFGAIGRMASAGVSMVGHLVGGIFGAFGRLASAGYRMVSSLLGGIRDSIYRLASAGYRLASAIVNGIVDGIRNLASRAWDAVKNLASGAWNAAKDFLGIGGPSRLFCEVGKNVADGFGSGVGRNTGSAVNSINRMGDRSLTAMRKTMSGMASVISDTNLDYTPTVAPVLDLTQFSKDAAKMSGLIATAPVNASLSYSQASDISNKQQAARAAAATSADANAPAPTKIEFNQTNTSPVALSSVEIYRLTKNQLSQAKVAIGLPASS